MDLEATVHALAPRLLAFCLGCAGSRTIAEDAAQDALTALVQRWRRHGSPDSPDAFAFAIARRRVHRSLLRRRILEPFLPDPEERTAEPDPEARTAGREEIERALRGIRELARGDREALLLAAVAGLDSRAAGRTLGISEAAFRMRLHRARRRLAECLGGRR